MSDEGIHILLFLFSLFLFLLLGALLFFADYQQASASMHRWRDYAVALSLSLA